MRVIFWVITSIVLAVFMIVAGMKHLVDADFFVPLVPVWMPFPKVAVYLSGIVELLLGVVTLFLNQKYTKYGLLGIFLLMVLYLPLHILDALRDQPVIGSETVAYLRLFLQFVLIWLAWNSYRFASTKTVFK